MADARPPNPTEEAPSPTAGRAHQGSELGGRLAELVASLRASPAPPAPPAGEPAPAGGSEGEEVARLRGQLAELEAAYQRVSEECAAFQEQNAELVTLSVAAGRLCEAADRAEALAAIQEIVVNLVGSEEFAVFERAADGRLLPVYRMGLDHPPAPITEGEGPAGRAVAEDRMRIVGDPPGEGEPVACVPLRASGQVVGALVVYGLLGHKPALTDFDREIFGVLLRHAGPALRAGDGS